MADLRNPAVRRRIHLTYASFVVQGKLPEFRAWIKLNPEKGWTVYLGSQFSPRSNLRFSFERDQLEIAHEFARYKVAQVMHSRIAMRARSLV